MAPGEQPARPHFRSSEIRARVPVVTPWRTRLCESGGRRHPAWRDGELRARAWSGKVRSGFPIRSCSNNTWTREIDDRPSEVVAGADL